MNARGIKRFKMQAFASALRIFVLALWATILFACDSGERKMIFKESGLSIERVSSDVYIHCSELLIKDYGPFPCNGLIICNDGEALVFDTPVDDSSAQILIQWIQEQLKCKIVSIIPTHFHVDCTGGLSSFHDEAIPSIASEQTIALSIQEKMPVAKEAFKDELILKLGNKEVYCSFPGEGHSRDNIVVYYPEKKILFGGCLIKALGAGKGNTKDANLKEWSKTVEKVKKRYKEVEIVVPGHGKYGDSELLDYTIALFSEQEKD